MAVSGFVAVLDLVGTGDHKGRPYKGWECACIKGEDGFPAYAGMTKGGARPFDRLRVSGDGFPPTGE